jgi:hypothetical protein
LESYKLVGVRVTCISLAVDVAPEILALVDILFSSTEYRMAG